MITSFRLKASSRMELERDFRVASLFFIILF